MIMEEWFALFALFALAGVCMVLVNRMLHKIYKETSTDDS